MMNLVFYKWGRLDNVRQNQLLQNQQLIVCLMVTAIQITLNVSTKYSEMFRISSDVRVIFISPSNPVLK